MTATINDVYVFDLDGAITNPHDSEIDVQVVQRIYELMANGTYVAANTGRSFDWVDRNLVSRITKYAGSDNAGVLAHFAAACEKGGEIITWVQGKSEIKRSESALSPEVYAVVKQTFEKNHPLLRSMFWDSSKRTMATIEKVSTAELGTFHDEQRILVETLTSLLAGHGVRIDPTTIATDVESPLAGKGAGAHLVYRWIQNLEPGVKHSFISFGDSISDYEMARYFATQGSSSTLDTWVSQQKLLTTTPK